jgi:hypothetical protein
VSLLTQHQDIFNIIRPDCIKENRRGTHKGGSSLAGGSERSKPLRHNTKIFIIAGGLTVHYLGKGPSLAGGSERSKPPHTKLRYL